MEGTRPAPRRQRLFASRRAGRYLSVLGSGEGKRSGRGGVCLQRSRPRDRGGESERAAGADESNRETDGSDPDPCEGPTQQNGAERDPVAVVCRRRSVGYGLGDRNRDERDRRNHPGNRTCVPVAHGAGVIYRREPQQCDTLTRREAALRDERESECDRGGGVGRSQQGRSGNRSDSDRLVPKLGELQRRRRLGVRGQCEIADRSESRLVLWWLRTGGDEILPGIESI